MRFDEILGDNLEPVDVFRALFDNHVIMLRAQAEPETYVGICETVFHKDEKARHNGGGLDLVTISY
jgi:hypothetical protein